MAKVLHAQRDVHLQGSLPCTDYLPSICHVVASLPATCHAVLLQAWAWHGDDGEGACGRQAHHACHGEDGGMVSAGGAACGCVHAYSGEDCAQLLSALAQRLRCEPLGIKEWHACICGTLSCNLKICIERERETTCVHGPWVAPAPQAG